MRILLFGVLLLLSYTTPVYADENPNLKRYTIDYNKSRISFSVILADGILEGIFKQFRGEIFFDSKEASNSRFSVEVDVNRVQINHSQYLTDLLSSNWLSAAKFEKAKFESTELHRIPKSDDFYGDGMMTIRGVTKPVTFNFRQEYNNGERAVVKGYVTLQRKDFNVGPDDAVTDENVKKTVRIGFRLHVSELAQ